MCGLTGIMSPVGAADRRTLHECADTMARALSHRGPDDQGLWQDPDVPLVLAHRRLSILDLSPEGHQPMSAESGRYVMVFNGEIYNFMDLRRPLEATGHVFRGRSDTEVLLAAIDRWGLSPTLEKINGMFAIALWDRQEKTLHLIRDRMGKKPLYVGWAGRDLVFASELKALHVHPDFRPLIHRESLAAYLRTGFICAPRCIYQNAWSLPPAARMTLPFNGLAPGESLLGRIEQYWSPISAVSAARTPGNPPPSDSGALESFDSVFESCVRDRMMADVPLGALLSGGLDSSAVVAMMQRLSSRPVKTYTIGFDETGFDESRASAKIAAHLGTDHHEARMDGAQALSIVPRLSDLYDEPFADASAIPTALVCTFARRDVTVALSGDGGDEMFGGYHRHVTGARLWSRTRWIPASMRSALARAVLARTPAWWDARLSHIPQAGQKLHKAAKAFSFGEPGQIHRSLLSHWPDPSSLLPGTAPPDFEPRMERRDLSFAEDMMLRDILTYLPHDVLVKVDRASMAAGIEARAPFLDGRMFDFSWSLPLSMKIRGRRGKWLLRTWLARQIPEALFDRPKQGFTPPIGAWLKGPLKEWTEDLLSDDSLRESDVSPAPVRNLWAEHLANRGDHAMQLWVVLTYCAWRRRWGATG